MHSFTFLTLLAAATITTAAPAANSNGVRECTGTGAYYVCQRNGFRGYCSVDPCDKSWCPDFTTGSCDPIKTDDKGCRNYTNHVKTASSSSTSSLIPTYTPTNKPSPTPQTITDKTTCAAGTGYYQVCASNGFKGCCKSDACGKGWCVDYKPWTYDPVDTPIKPAASSSTSSVSTVTIVYTPTSTTVVACTPTPVYTPPPACATPSAAPSVGSGPGAKSQNDPTTCAAGFGYFQVCSNGFRGCCKSDACGKVWCPDYKPGSYEPMDIISRPTDILTKASPSQSTITYKSSSTSTTSVQKSSDKPSVPSSSSSSVTILILTTGSNPKPTLSSSTSSYKWSNSSSISTSTHSPTVIPSPGPKPSTGTDATICPAGVGYYQVCATNGFKGCCRSDACGKNWCVDYQPGTYVPVDNAASKSSASSTSTFNTVTKNSTPAPTGSSDETVCPAGKGYYQVCQTGFKGCCKQDACALGHCPSN
jgi:hypothetical protein